MYLAVLEVFQQALVKRFPDREQAEEWLKLKMTALKKSYPNREFYATIYIIGGYWRLP